MRSIRREIAGRVEKQRINCEEGDLDWIMPVKKQN
jgi:hypothetical protein